MRISMQKVKSIFVAASLLFLGSLHAADDQALQIITLDSVERTRTITVPQHVVEQCHVLNKLHSNGVSDFRISAHHQDFLLYEPLKHVLDAMEHNPNNNIHVYQQYLTSIDPEDITHLWKCLDYLIGPVEFRIAASNCLIDNDRCEEVDKISLKATVRSLQDALSSNQANLSKQRITHVHPITGLDEKHPQQRIQGDTVDLSHNLLTQWSNESSNAITNLAPNIQQLDLSHNMIQSIPAHSFHEVPRNTYINMQDNRFNDQTISDQAVTGGKNLTIDLRRNNISQQKIYTLRQLTLRKGLLTRIKQLILQNRHHVHNITALLSIMGCFYSVKITSVRVDKFVEKQSALGHRVRAIAFLLSISVIEAFGTLGLGSYLDSPAMRNGNWITNIISPFQANTIISDHD